VTAGGLLADFEAEFRKHKGLADKALPAVDDAAFFARPGEAVNPVALIVKHLAGNRRSRWTDFLTTDGEKPDRDRDGEFLLREGDTRESLTAAWERGWQTVFESLAGLTDTDLDRTVTVRGESHTARQAILRNLTHAAYHVGQLAYLSRLATPDAPWLTIAPGQSGQHAAGYLKGK